MEFRQWEAKVAPQIRSDVLWKLAVYRLALYSADLAWGDVTTLSRDRRTVGLSDQLYRSVGSISANIAEGYSRSSSKERAHFYEYALGSARESRDWYFKARHVLSDDVVTQRSDVLSQIIKLLLVMVPQQRGRSIQEETALYRVDVE